MKKNLRDIDLVWKYTAVNKYNGYILPNKNTFFILFIKLSSKISIQYDKYMKIWM